MQSITAQSAGDPRPPTRLHSLICHLLRLSRTPVRLERAGPVLGEHTVEVLTDLGLTEAEIHDLQQAGAIAPVPAKNVRDGLT